MKMYESNLKNPEKLYKGIISGSTIVRIVVKDIVGINCITIDSGESVFKPALKELKKGRTVILDFLGVEKYATPFFNFAIGQLLFFFEKEEISGLLKFDNLDELGRRIVEIVINNSERYYRDERYRKAVDEIIGHKSDEWECDLCPEFIKSEAML